MFGLRKPAARDLLRQLVPLPLSGNTGVEPHRDGGVLELALAVRA
jgi:hypothetical protein